MNIFKLTLNKQNSLKIFLIFVFLFPFNLKALNVTSYTCSQTYRTVQVGNTMDAVRAACGEPTSKTTQDVPVDSTIDTAQWVYTASVKVKDNLVSMPILVVTIKNGQVSQIERTTIAAPLSTSCATPGIINVGDPQATVLATCGQPNIVNSRQKASTDTKQVTRWIYNFGPYKPAVTFEFDSTGVLTQISS